MRQCFTEAEHKGQLQGRVKAIRVPSNSAGRILPHAFSHNTEVRHVQVEAGICIIGEAAWRSCLRLQVVQLPETVVPAGSLACSGSGPLVGNVLWWTCPLTGNVVGVSLPLHFSTLRPNGSGGKSPVVGTKLWWCLPHLLSPQKLCLTRVCFPSFFPTTPAPPGVSFPPLLLHKGLLHTVLFPPLLFHMFLLSHHSCFTRVCFTQFSSHHSCSTCSFFPTTPASQGFASQTRSALAGKKCLPALAAQQQAGLHLKKHRFLLYMEHSCFWMKLHTDDLTVRLTGIHFTLHVGRVQNRGVVQNRRLQSHWFRFKVALWLLTHTFCAPNAEVSTGKASCATKTQNFKRPQAKVSCNSCIPKHFQKANSCTSTVNHSAQRAFF